MNGFLNERKHFLEKGKNVNYSVERAGAILDDMLQQVEPVIQQVLAKLLKEFPRDISQPTFDGMHLIKLKLEK